MWLWQGAHRTDGGVPAPALVGIQSQVDGVPDLLTDRDDAGHITSRVGADLEFEGRETVANSFDCAPHRRREVRR